MRPDSRGWPRPQKQTNSYARHPIVVRGSEHVLFSGEVREGYCTTASLGCLKSGNAAVNIRLYEFDSRSAWRPTRFGCTLTLAEFSTLVARFNDKTLRVFPATDLPNIRPDESLLFAPAIPSNVRPCVTLGVAGGHCELRFRTYRVNGSLPFDARGAFAALTDSELSALVKRIHELVKAIPSVNAA